MISHVGYHNRRLIITSSKQRLSIQLTPIEYKLNELRVMGHKNKAPLLETAGSITKLTSKDFRQFNNTSIQPALNTVPGVKMESRGDGGSRRISIRGSLLRSPWGVRNISVYWNGIPLTNPSGSSPLEVIDPTTVTSGEVIKGPTSSVYGPGTGGTILFYSDMPQHNEYSLTSRAMAGSYFPIKHTDYWRQGQQLRYQKGKLSLAANYIKQHNKGYRQQEANNKDFLSLHTVIEANKQQKISLHALHYDGMWELPGALTKEQIQSSPRQADAFSIWGEAAVHRTRNRLGISHKYQFTDNFSNQTIFYGNITRKHNPYGTSPYYNGYKITHSSGGGGRTEFTLHPKLPHIKSEVLLGGEWHLNNKYLEEYSNDQGTPGILQEDVKTLSQQYMGFLQWRNELPHRLFLTVGISSNHLTFDHTDYFYADSIDYSGEHRFTPSIAPRIALVKKFGDKFSIHGNISKGFSTPTLWEVSNPDGSFNTELQAESGTNHEIGFRSSLLDNHLQVDLSGYFMKLKNAIVPRETKSGTIFRNQGRTHQWGAELQSSYTFTPANSLINQIQPTISYTEQYYFFKDYYKNGTNYEGNRVTGIPPRMLYARLNSIIARHIKFNITYRYVGAIPINDANTVFADPYHVIDTKLTFDYTILSHLQSECFIGIDNLLDTQYSSFLQLNGFNRKYYNPAPGRNIYAGLSLTYHFNKR